MISAQEAKTTSNDSLGQILNHVICAAAIRGSRHAIFFEDNYTIIMAAKELLEENEFKVKINDSHSLSIDW